MTAMQLDLLDLLAPPVAGPSNLPLLADTVFPPGSWLERDLVLARNDSTRMAQLKRGIKDSSYGGCGRRPDNSWWSWTLTRGRYEIRLDDAFSAPDEVHPLPVVIAHKLSQLTPEREQQIRDQHTADLAERSRRRSRFDELTTRWPDGTAVTWTAPYDCGVPAGTTTPARRCWLCGDVEVTEYLLELNHNVGPHWHDPDDVTSCSRMRRRQPEATS